VSYSTKLANSVAVKKSIGVEAPAETALCAELTAGTAKLMDCAQARESALAAVPESDSIAVATYYYEAVLPRMEEARAAADAMETKVSKTDWPMPTYSDILYYL